MSEYIHVVGASTNNLKNIDVKIPINKITCLKGPSGSGKTSLAFSTLYVESRRRYLNSMPDGFKFFASKDAKPDVTEIKPILPAFALPQSNPVLISRSTVADVIGLSEKIQKLFFFLGEQYCPDHLELLKKTAPKDVIKRAFAKNKVQCDDVIHLFISKETFENYYSALPMPNRFFNLDEKLITSDPEEKYYELIRFRYKSVDQIDKKFSQNFVFPYGKEVIAYNSRSNVTKSISVSDQTSCSKCGLEGDKVQIEALSPYNALGACSKCNGHGALLILDDNKIFPNRNLSIREGAFSLDRYKRLKHFFRGLVPELKKNKFPVDTAINKLSKADYTKLFDGVGKFRGLKSIEKYLDSKKYKKDVRILLRNIQKEEPCELCEGSRLGDVAKKLYADAKDPVSYIDFVNCDFNTALKLISQLNDKNNNYAKYLISAITQSLKVAIDVGLENLRLTDKTKNLSTGEYQRLLMIKYLSYQGSESLFIFDEPALGLEQDEVIKIFSAIERLRDQGNTIIIIEHNEFFHNKSDYIIEMGPAAGHYGGEIISCYENKSKKNSKTTKSVKKFFKKAWDTIELEGIEYKSLKNISLKFPKNKLTQVIGKSASQKSQIIYNVLGNELFQDIHNIDTIKEYSISKKKIPRDLKEVYTISSNFGNVSSRSTVGSYLDLIEPIRKHFTNLKYSKSLGLQKGHFSKNSALGRCEECEGRGHKFIEMVYMEDLKISCESCEGKGLKKQYADISDGYMTAYQAFQMPMNKVFENIHLTPKFKRILEYVRLLNLDYLSVDRSLNGLSGGERQRINLLNTLLSKVTDSVILIENLSFGLSDTEMLKMTEFIGTLTDFNNTFIVVDSHPILSQKSDYICDFNKMA